jgi:hypothetical protein
VLSLSLGGVVTREYDGSTLATVLPSQLQVSGAVGGDQIALGAHSSAAYTTAGNGPGVKDVGSQKTVEATGVTLLSASLNQMPVYGYSLASGTASGPVGEITPKAVSLSASKTYDGLLALGQGAVTVNTGVGSETLTYSQARSNDAHAGTAQKYIAALSLGDAGDGSGGLALNYKLPVLNASTAPVTITAKQLTASASIAAVDKSYDGLIAATGMKPALGKP